MTDRAAAVEELYGLLDELADRCGGYRTLAECSSRSGWPRLGVYFFFEPGEFRAESERLRVVRVGTHALRPSKSTLWGRLSQHRGSTAGSMPGGGNHRGSIFRLHVGTALLNTGICPEAAATWGKGGSAAPDVRRIEYPLERAVSDYIGAMPLLWLAVDDPAGADSDRGIIEAGCIALLSNAGKPIIDPPSPGWLGHHADREAVRRSGLWNVNHVTETSNPVALALLSAWVAQQ